MPSPLARRVVLTPRVVLARTAAGTRALAKKLARSLEGGAVLALVGELGAGKTSFVQGLAAGLEIFDQRQVLSPSYTLVNEYPGPRLALVHIDCFRLTDLEGALSLGIEEQIGRGDAVTAIEWADLLPELVPSGALWIRLATLAEGGRRIVLGGLP